MAAQTFDFSHEMLSCQDALRFFALSLTRNGEDADDLVQETMVKALVYQDRFTAHTNLRAWLYTIMKNIFINEYRKQQKMRTVVDGSKDLARVTTSAPLKTYDPESALNYQQLCQMLAGLDSEYSVPLQMYFEGYKYKDIADALDLPMGTVKSRIFLARKMMMEQLNSEMSSGTCNYK